MRTDFAPLLHGLTTRPRRLRSNEQHLVVRGSGSDKMVKDASAGSTTAAGKNNDALAERTSLIFREVFCLGVKWNPCQFSG